MFINLLRLIRDFAALGKNPTRKSQRVRLISKKNRASSENPIIGTKYECEGTVIFIDQVGTYGIRVSVEWDNSFKSAYDPNELLVSDLPCTPHPYHFKPNFAKDNPNYTFKERKASLRYLNARSPMKGRDGTWL